MTHAFTAKGASPEVTVRAGEQLSYAVTGTFVATVVLEQQRRGKADWYALATLATTGSGTVLVEEPGKTHARVRFRCTAFTSGTVDVAITEVTSEVTSALRDAAGTPVLNVTEDGIAVPSGKTLTATGAVLTTPSLVAPLGVLVAIEALFTQTTGDGVYTASFAIPAGATIRDVIVTNTAVWNAGTSATLKIGINGGDDDCFFTAVDLNTVPAAGKSISFAWPGNAGGASVPEIDGGAGNQQLGATSGFLYNATAKTVDAVVTQVGTGTLGRTRVTVLYSLPVSVASATKV